MFCPFCQAEETKVIDSRLSNGHVRRRRECTQCQARFNTKEIVEFSMPRVIKRDQSRETFDEEKLRAGVLKALEKRPISLDHIETAVGQMIEQLRACGEREIASREIGEIIMPHLLKLDPVAYIRFASVYRSFEDIKAFRDEIQRLEKELNHE